MSRPGEFELIDLISRRFPPEEGIVGIGDDCAIIPQNAGMETLVSTDMLVEGVHFLREDIPAFDLGWKSAAVNISDIAAMGGRPVASFLSIAIPEDVSGEYLMAFIDGYKALSDKFGSRLLGGDTTSSKDGLCISVTVYGECPRGKAVRRSGAKPGDLVCVTGTLGDSAAGLKVILDAPGAERSELEEELVRRHYRPLPRVAEGIALAGIPVSAMMDISDGIASDLRHILKASSAGGRIDCAALPLSEQIRKISSLRGYDPVRLALEGGEDYELLFTVAPDVPVNVEHTVIGVITEGGGLKWTGREDDFMGFRHF